MDQDRTDFAVVHILYKLNHIFIITLTGIQNSAPVNRSAVRTNGFIDRIHNHLYIGIVASAYHETRTIGAAASEQLTLGLGVLVLVGGARHGAADRVVAGRRNRRCCAMRLLSVNQPRQKDRLLSAPNT